MGKVIESGSRATNQLGGTGGLAFSEAQMSYMEHPQESEESYAVIARFLQDQDIANAVSYLQSLVDRRKGAEGMHFIYPVGDSGGHTRDARSIFGTVAGGDAGHLMALTIRNAKTRRIFLHRWNEEGPRKNVRIGTELIASAEVMEGSHSAGIKLLSEAFRCDMRGELKPVSDDNYYIRALLADGSSRFGEDEIDKMTWDDPDLTGITYVDQDNNEITPHMTPESIESIISSEFYTICSATPEGTHGQIDNMPEYQMAHGLARPIRIGVMNAVRTPDSKHHTVASLTERYATKMGQPFDIVVVNIPTHGLPEDYLPLNWREKFAHRSGDIQKARRAAEEYVFLPNDLKPKNDFAKLVVAAPLSRIEYIGKSVVRHDGMKTFNTVQRALADLKS